MTTQRIFTSRTKTAFNTFVGNKGLLFYNENTGELRISDGRTPGGTPVFTAVTTASIGDLLISETTIGSIRANENIKLQSNGTGTIAVVGGFNVTTPAPGSVLVMEIPQNGFVNFYAAQQLTADSAFEIIGSSNGVAIKPTNTGVMLQVTGNYNTSSRIYNDSSNSSAVYTGRRYNGTASSPTAVQAGQDIVRYGGSAYNGSILPIAGNARMAYTALETQTDNAGGSSISFWTTPVGSPTSSIAPVMTLTNSAVTLAASALPAADNGVNLGSAYKRFANLFLGYDGLFLADQTTDANINITVNSGTLYIDGAANLAIGNLVIRDTTLQSLTTDLDISIGATDDTGFFYIKRKAQFNNTSFSSTQPMVSMNASGFTEPTTLFPDTVLQTTGRLNKNSRIVQRSYGSLGEVGGDNSYSVWASYVSRGTVVAPAALKQNDILARISANGYGTTSWGSGGARIEFVALENFTDTAKGTRINFWTVPVGQVASQNVASINSVGIIAKGIEFSNDSTVQTTAGIPLTAKAVTSATYVATLGIDGKLDASQIPASLTGAVVFKGTWNATTNTPALSDSTPAGLIAGWEYIVDVGGTRNIGDGSKVFVSGDFVIFDGTHWKQVPSGNLFTSLTGGGGITVNQSTGAIILGSNATPNSTTSTIVSRDASGNFGANVITANLTGNVTGNISGSAGSATGNAATASKLFAATTINGVSFDGSAPVTVHTAGTGISVNGTTVTNIGVVGTGTLMTNAVNATTATNAAYAYSFNTSTLVANAVSATTSNYATTSGYALSFNTATLVTSAVNATNAVNATTATLARTATTATNLTVATSILAGKLSAATGSVAKNSVATVTYTITGLTTNHKIIITPGTVTPDRQFHITAAWASALNTVSIEYANNSGGAISVTFDINYFAFV
jgi:hypothetical protein